MTAVYAFTGKKLNGKSTAADYVLTKIPTAQRINFKDALLEEVKTNFPNLIAEILTIMDKTAYDGWGWSVERLIAEKPPLFRTLLQNYGTEVRRGDDKGYWANKWIVAAKYHDVVCDDVRFIQEAEAVRALGGTIIRIVRPSVKNDDLHSSEQEMTFITPDYTITAETKEELYTALDGILEQQGHRVL